MLESIDLDSQIIPVGRLEDLVISAGKEVKEETGYYGVLVKVVACEKSVFVSEWPYRLMQASDKRWRWMKNLSLRLERLPRSSVFDGLQIVLGSSPAQSCSAE